MLLQLHAYAASGILQDLGGAHSYPVSGGVVGSSLLKNDLLGLTNEGVLVSGHVSFVEVCEFFSELNLDLSFRIPFEAVLERYMKREAQSL